MMARVPTVTGFLALALVVVSVGCAPLVVNTFSDRRTDFTQYRTYGWELAGTTYTGDPRLDANPFFHRYVAASIDEHLAVRGIEPAASGMPGLLVRYFASTEQKISLTTGGKNTDCTDCRVEVFDEGTLIIDFVDARTGTLVWRGWAEASAEGVVEDQAWMERRIYDAVTRILSRLPAGFGRAMPVT